jgi:hypothetical protein
VCPDQETDTARCTHGERGAAVRILLGGDRAADDAVPAVIRL